MELREKLIADGEWQMVLTGQAGIGKTTSLRYLQYQDRQNYQPQKPIPVYLDLGSAREGQSIKAWIVKELQVGRLALAKNLEKSIDLWLENGLINLYVDGWNELAIELKDALFKDMQQFMRDYPKVFIAITIRETDSIFHNVPVFILQNMSKEQVIEFVNKNTNDSEKTLRQLLRQQIAIARFLEFITVPLHALMWVQIVRKDSQTILKSGTDIIDAFIERLFVREKEKHGSDFIAKKLGMKLETFSNLLSIYAFYCLHEKKSQNSALSSIAVQKVFKKLKNQMPLPQIRQLLDFAVELGLMVKDEEDFFKFTHQNYLDYFAARGMRMKRKMQGKF